MKLPGIAELVRRRVALVVLGALVCIALVASALLPEGPTAPSNSSAILLATIHSFPNLLFTSACVLLVSTGLSLVLGVLAVRSRYGWDASLALAVELGGAVPAVVLAALLSVLEPGGRTVAMALSLGVVRAVRMGRLLRGQLRLQETARHVTAARALGLTDARVMISHRLPYALRPWMSQAASCVLYVATVQMVLAAAGFHLYADRPTLGFLLVLGLRNPTFSNLLPLVCVGLLSGALYGASDDAARALLPMTGTNRGWPVRRNQTK